RQRDDRLAGGDPGDHALDQVGRSLGHAPTGTGWTKPAALAAEGQQQLFMAGVTPQPHKAMGKNATPQIVIKFALHIGGETLSGGIGVERGEKRLQMVRAGRIEYRLARITWHTWGG